MLNIERSKHSHLDLTEAAFLVFATCVTYTCCSSNWQDCRTGTSLEAVSFIAVVNVVVVGWIFPADCRCCVGTYTSLQKWLHSVKPVDLKQCIQKKIVCETLTLARFLLRWASSEHTPSKANLAYNKVCFFLVKFVELPSSQTTFIIRYHPASSAGRAWS